MKKHMLASVPFLTLSLFGAAAGQAQEKPIMVTNPDAKAAAAFWTPERFKSAKPLPMPHADPATTMREEPAAAPAGKAESSDGHAPAQFTRPPAKRLFTPEPGKGTNGGVVSPGAVGSFGAHYTSSRVFPLFTGTSAPFSADRAYPYITVGTLFFSIDNVAYLCSASAIQNRIIVTAGHCVHSGTSSGFYSNWVFVPAFRDGTAPLLTWNWRAAIVTGTWATGGGTVPNAADYAMIEVGDQPVNGVTRSLGFVTGWLGWQTRSLSANHTSKLGYPCNLDRCQKMQNVTSGAFRNTAPNNVEYGSDAEGGSSGGPWVQNFQMLQTGGGSGSNTGSNRVVGVTSYGYVPNDAKVQGASIPDARWISILNTLCSRVPGNCL